MTADTAATTQSYDTFVAAVMYGSSQTMESYEWEVYDLYGTVASLPYSVNGAFPTGYNGFLDTAQ